MPAPVTDLFCFAAAGGGGAGYRPWQAPLAPDVRVNPIVLPGREGRGTEPPITDFARLIGKLRSELNLESRAQPFAFFGHSLGAMVAYELCVSLHQDGLRLPVCLIVSGRRSPFLPARTPMQHVMEDDDLLRALAELGGTPPEILASSSFLKPFLTVLRADLALNETYRPRDNPPVLDTRLVAYAGTRDALATPDEVAEWRRCAGRSFGLRVFRGGHFFINSERTPVLTSVREDVRSGLAERATTTA